MQVFLGNYGQCAYAAAKEGIRGLTRVAATEWGPDGINVNVVCPLAWTAQLENFGKMHILTHLRQTLRCHQWDIMEMLKQKSVESAYSWHHLILKFS